MSDQPDPTPDATAAEIDATPTVLHLPPAPPHLSVANYVGNHALPEIDAAQDRQPAEATTDRATRTERRATTSARKSSPRAKK